MQRFIKEDHTAQPFSEFFPGYPSTQKSRLEDAFYEVLKTYTSTSFPFSEVKTDPTLKVSPYNPTDALLTKTAYLTLKEIIEDISGGLDQDGNLLQKLQDSLNSLPYGVLNNMPKEWQVPPLQEMLFDRYCDKLSSPKITADLLKALEMLFEAGASKDIKNFNHQGSLLHCLMYQPLPEHDPTFFTQFKSMHNMIKFLHAKEFDFNAKDLNGNTPLHIAATKRLHPLVFEALIACGAGLNIANKGKHADAPETPLDMLNGTKDNKTLLLLDFVTKAGGKGWRELSFNQHDTYQFGYRYNFNLLSALKRCNNFDFSLQRHGKSFFDLCLEQGILADLFNCPMLRAAIQSKLPQDKMNVLISEVQMINAKRDAEIQQQNKEKEAAEARQLALKEQIEGEKKSEEASQHKIIKEIVDIANVCKMPCSEKRKSEFSEKFKILDQDSYLPFDVKMKAVESQLKTAQALKNFGLYSKAYKPAEKPIAMEISPCTPR